jgi:hypothetical protein
VPRRTQLHVLLLCVLAALVPVAVLVVFALSDRVAGWLPHSTVFVAVFVCAALGLLIWVSGITGRRGAAEREIYVRAVGRFASWLRPKRRG